MKSCLDDFIPHRLWAQVLHGILYEKTNLQHSRIIKNWCYFDALLLENLWHSRIIKNLCYLSRRLWALLRISNIAELSRTDAPFEPCWESAISLNYLELTPYFLWLCLKTCAWILENLLYYRTFKIWRAGPVPGYFRLCDLWSYREPTPLNWE